MTLHAEISVIPICRKGESSMGKQIAVAFEAIRKTRGVKATLTALGTQIEARDMNSVLRAVRAAHESLKKTGTIRIISSIRIDERLDKDQTLEDKIRSVRNHIPE